MASVWFVLLSFVMVEIYTKPLRFASFIFRGEIKGLFLRGETTKLFFVILLTFWLPAGFSVVRYPVGGLFLSKTGPP